MKCEHCGKTISKNEIIIPIIDRDTKEVIDFFHASYETFQKFKKFCEERHFDPGVLFETYMMNWLVEQEK